MAVRAPSGGDPGARTNTKRLAVFLRSGDGSARNGRWPGQEWGQKQTTLNVCARKFQVNSEKRCSGKDVRPRKRETGRDAPTKWAKEPCGSWSSTSPGRLS